MIELRGLHLGNIARTPAESVRPDLWPDHAWVPALGVQGSTLMDISGSAHGSVSTPSLWDGAALTNNASANRFVNCSSMYGAGALVLPFTFMAVVKANYSESYTAALSAGIYIESGDYSIIGASYGCPTLVHRVGAGPVCRASSTTRIDDGDWHTIIGVFFSANPGGYLYADGVLQGASTGPFTQINYDATVIGTFARLSTYDYGDRYNGSIAMCGIFRRELITSEIGAISADPLLPFRRRVPVYYSMPRSTETPAAMMMGI